MDTIWSFLRKKEAAIFVLVVAGITFVTSVIACGQNYRTTYGQLALAFGPDIGLTFTVFTQVIEFLVPMLLAWGIMKSLRVDTKVTVIVVATGVAAWVTDVVTAYEHFSAVSQATLRFRPIAAGIGAFLFVTMEIWVILSLVMILSAISVLRTKELPAWLTRESTITTPMATEHRSAGLGIGSLIAKIRSMITRPRYTRVSRQHIDFQPSVSLSPEIRERLPKANG